MTSAIKQESNYTYKVLCKGEAVSLYVVGHDAPVMIVDKYSEVLKNNETPEQYVKRVYGG